ncbi:MAG: TRAP transporter small permease [Burkholderiaceae bacterium]|jgi:TRAP-type C4-dicarboxylate transport system permease small subunit|nr:TRAP transporter small permease [Burkholderiaceae bacterium]MDP4968599.1 TRAP transporter small permease [Burkholderiaceae bacterium]
MRRFLDGMYSAAEFLAAVSLVGVLLTVLLSIFSRLLTFHISGLDAYAGYFLAAVGFFALASTLRNGEHIRVTILLNVLAKQGKRKLDIGALFAGTLIAGTLAYFSAKLAFDSYMFNDISTSNDATPLWIPQLTMAAGNILFLIAFLDTLVGRIRGESMSSNSQEPARNE